MSRTSQDIQHEIDRLQTELEAAREEEKGQWPRKVEIYMYVSKDDMREAGQFLGLSGKTLSTFSYEFHEVGLILNVQKDGTARIAEVNGVPLCEKS